MTTARTLFPGAMGPEGFISCFDHLMDDALLRRKLILKGGPGVGKSTFMRRVHAALCANGEPSTLYFCSGDPDSLDGVAVPHAGLLDPFPAAVLVFAVNEGAYCAETMRAALESVPVGQIEAGYCVGMRYMQIMRRIVLPQALRTAFPPLSNSLIAMVKDTSLASNITVMEMFMATQRIAARTYEMLPLYCEVAVIYLMFSTVLTFVQRWGEKKLAVYGGRRRAK